MGQPGAPTRRDAVVPVLLAAVGTVEALSVNPPGAFTAIGIEWAASLLLVLRRRWTLAVCTLAGGVLFIPYLGPRVDDLTGPILILALAGFSLGRYLPDLRGLAVMGLINIGVLGAFSLTNRRPPPVGDVVWISTLLLAPYCFGLLARTLDDRNRRLAEQAEQLARAQERVRQEAAAAERTRIARELHDVIAHSIGAMVVQATAAEELVRADPDRAATALAEVTAVGRRALADTGRLLHLLRDRDGEMGLEPDQGLDRLPDLVDGFRRSGLAVDLAVDGAVGRLPAGVDLSAYRIVREALTNALRHGSDRTSSVRIERRDGALDIRVENPAPAGDERAGLGLVGIAERVSVFGGRLTHGRTPDGRYVLAASLPLGEGEA